VNRRKVKLLTGDEAYLLQEYREAIAEAKDGEEVMVHVFVGSPKHCEKLDHTYKAFRYLQAHHVDVPIESFVFPIPKEPQDAAVMRAQVLHNIKKIFQQHYPAKSVLN